MADVGSRFRYYERHYSCALCIRNEAAQVHEADRRRGGYLAASGARATGGPAPGVTRTWHSIEDYVTDVNNARIWAGVHYRFSTEVGAAMGRKISDLAVQNYMMVAAQ